MREIKFRAFQDNQMLISPISTNYGLQRFFGLLYEDTPVMQYTGLKDCNGKEIYEGDIVKYSSDAPVVVTYENQGFIASNCNDTCKSPLKVFTDINKWVVIGNIYENPELI